MLCKRGFSRHAVSVRLSARVSVTFLHAFCQNEYTYLHIFYLRLATPF